MPLYEYYCSDCRTKFDVLRPMSKADDPIACEECESRHTARVISLIAVSVAGGDGASLMPSGGGCACGGGGCGCHGHS